METKNLDSLSEWAIKFVTNLHPDDTEFIFLSGSLIRGGFNKLSDIDYTACVREKPSHPKFMFRIVAMDGVLRPMSIFFHTLDELNLPENKIDEEYYLWIKKMMLNAKFVHGNEESFNQIVEFNKTSNLERKASHKTLHKSLGKLLELIQKVKKYEVKEDEEKIIYYGVKLAEHVRRLVQELNAPLALESESQFFKAYSELENSPKDFANLYAITSRNTTSAVTLSEYFVASLKLVENTFAWVQQAQNIAQLDDFSKAMLEDPDTSKFLMEIKDYSLE